MLRKCYQLCHYFLLLVAAATLGCESIQCRCQLFHHDEWVHHALGLRA
jgi:hypothetical protein